MKLAIIVSAAMAGSVAAFAPSHASSPPTTTALSETKADLQTLAKKLNPVVPFFDPLGLADQSFWNTSPEETINFLRESEVKHGRIAMFAFVGYIVHANGITFPWALSLDGTPFPKGVSPPEAWDAISDNGKLQIIAFIGFLEVWREIKSGTHYMKGGKIGYFPPFDATYIPGGALNLYDPFGWRKNLSEEQKANGLVKEINNGRLAMLGIFGFLSESKAEGSVPLLTGIIPHYGGDAYVAPFANSILPSF